jgi:hypothetical protein
MCDLLTDTSQLFNKTISPAVFDHIVVGFGLDDRRLSSTPERGDDIAEESAWIKVWVSCVKIVVDNRQRVSSLVELLSCAPLILCRHGGIISTTGVVQNKRGYLELSMLVRNVACGYTSVI